MPRLSYKPFTGAIVMATQLAGCASAPPARFIRSPGQFTPCPKAPHCVSSQADPNDSHYLPPLEYRGEAAKARAVLLQTLQAENNAKIVRADEDFIHATFHTTLGFVDDVTFLVQPQAQVIDVKSASRVGYYDFGVNRKRVERLRTEFESRLRT